MTEQAHQSPHPSHSLGQETQPTTPGVFFGDNHRDAADAHASLPGDPAEVKVVKVRVHAGFETAKQTGRNDQELPRQGDPNTRSPKKTPKDAVRQPLVDGDDLRQEGPDLSIKLLSFLVPSQLLHHLAAPSPATDLQSVDRLRQRKDNPYTTVAWLSRKSETPLMAATEMCQDKACRLETFRMGWSKQAQPPGVKEQDAGHPRDTSDSRHWPGGRGQSEGG